MNVLVIAGLLVFLLTFIAVLIGVTRRSNSPKVSSPSQPSRLAWRANPTPPNRPTRTTRRFRRPKSRSPPTADAGR